MCADCVPALGVDLSRMKSNQVKIKAILGQTSDLINFLQGIERVATGITVSYLVHTLFDEDS